MFSLLVGAFMSLLPLRPLLNPRHPLLSNLTMHYSTTNKSCSAPSILWHTILSEFNLLRTNLSNRGGWVEAGVTFCESFFSNRIDGEEMISGHRTQTHYIGGTTLQLVIECTGSGQTSASIGILPFHCNS